ncbi:MAG: methionyl-tRNA formyltransferase [Chloroflexi bacterium]|nr:methionyl-tRNA formyltransferase [Chloroflexota bacterium]
MRIVFMGTPSFAVPVLASLMTISDSQLVGVYTPPDRPAGRGRQPQASPVKEHALEHDLPIFQPVNFRSQEVQDELAALKPDVIVVAAYGKLLPKPVLDLAPLGCLNIHPSILPRYRGPSPVVTSILNGDLITGVTIMLLDEGMDTGPLIAQHEFFMKGNETAEGLTTELFELGGELLQESLAKWQSGELLSEPQNEALASVTRKFERSDGLVDWSLSAVELERRVRAFNPWPGVFTHWNDSSLKIIEASIISSSSTEFVPGTVVGTNHPDVAAAVATSEGFLGLHKVQLEGKRAVDAKDFLNGSPSFIGSQL